VNGHLYLAAGAMRRIWRYPLGSMLVLVAATLGVAGVVCSVDYAAAGRRKVLEQIRRLGANTLVVSAQQSRGAAGRARTGTLVTTLVEADYRAIRRDVDGIGRASRLVNRGLRVKGAGYSKVVAIVGCEPDFFAIRNWPVSTGDVFDGDDLRRSRRVVVLGATVARDLFGFTAAAGARRPEGGGRGSAAGSAVIGQRLAIGRVPFEVVGVLAERGQGLDLADEDGQVYVPLTAAMRRLLNLDSYASILVEVDGRQPLERVAAQVGAVLRRRHHGLPRVPEDFTVQSQRVLADTQLAASSKLAFLVRWIGASALAVSGLGILAIAWIGVRARTVEVGTRRALGATAGGIFAQLLFEAALLAVLGCAAGLGAGWEGSLLLARRDGLRFVFEWRDAAAALASALVLNLLFAVLPARRAARLDPIRALRHE
jgi:putative ABC transport system permease protein